MASGSPLLGLIRKTPGKLVTKGRESSTRPRAKKREERDASTGGCSGLWQELTAKAAQGPCCTHQGLTW